MRMGMSLIGRLLATALFPISLMTSLSRAKVVIYDLKKYICYTLTQPWDRSVDELGVRLGILVVLRNKH
jgi:hypothetical protein